MYYQYWDLTKPPFDNVPDPSMYVDTHLTLENAVAETLFAIEEGGESIAVIVGDVGLGKTLSLRLIIDSLDQDRYRIVLITNPSITFIQLMKEIIGQLTGAPCDKTRKVDLLETFNRLLFETIDEGKKVLVFIDEANAIPPANLEYLRLLTNMQDDQRNLFTMILAGQKELARRLEDPRRANLFQRIGTYNKIEKIPSAEALKDYVETRLRLAGCTRAVFADDVYGPLWNRSEEGVPRLVNKICKLSLKAGETNGLDLITGAIVDQIGQRFQRLSGSAARKRKQAPVLDTTVTPETIRDTEQILADHERQVPEPVVEKPEPVPPVEKQIPLTEQAETFIEAPEPVTVMSPEPVEETPTIHTTELPERGQPRLVYEQTEPDTPPQKSAPADEDKSVEVEIGGMKATVVLPFQVIRQAQCSTEEHCVKLAGVLAAQFLKEHPTFTSSFLSDPVDVWSRIRESVLQTFAEEKRIGVM